MAAKKPADVTTDTALGARVDGVWQAGGSHVAVFLPGTVGRAERGLFAIAIDLAGPAEGREAQSRQMLEAAKNAYFQATGTITMGLRKAVEAANDTLYQANLTTLREQRRHAGISVAALVDADLYLGQAGPSLIYVMQAGDLLQFPADSPWLSNEEKEGEGGWYPLGVRRSIQVDLYHVEVGDDDTVVMTSPVVGRLARPDYLEAVLDQAPSDIVTDLDQLAANAPDTPDLVALALRLAGTGVETTPALPPVEGDAAAPTTETEPEAERAVVPPVGAWLGQKSKDVAGNVGRGASTVFKGALPDRPAGESVVPRGPQLWRLLALVNPLIVLAIVIGLTLRSSAQRRAQDEQVATLLTEAQERLTAATGSQADRQSVLNLLNDAEQRAQDALKIRPNNEAARKLLNDVRAAKEEGAGVYRLADLSPLAALTEPGTIAQKVWVAGPYAYLLDSGLNRVVRVRLDGAASAPETVLKSGDAVGGRTVGDLADLVWLRAGGARTIEDVAALGRDGALYAISPTGAKTAIGVGGSRDWQNPLVADTYGGNFYLAQAEKGQILKYTPTGNDAFSDAATPWLAQPADLKGLVDMGIDGQIYTLMGDGRVRRFSAGKEDKFDLKGFDQPLASPRALFVAPDSKSLYVVENGRVVEMTKDGAFVRQFQPAPDDKPFDDPRAVFVDEKAERVYVVNGNTLFAASLPKLKATKTQ